MIKALAARVLPIVSVKISVCQIRGAMKYLPEELILQILLRLPVKSLLRFRSVCKSWMSLISNPHFAKSHFDLAAAQTDRILLVAVDGLRSVDFEASLHDLSASVKLNFPLIPAFSSVKIRGSCRGFLLLDDRKNFFVCNPSTGLCRRIPYSPISYWRAFHGIGYDASKDDYLVVLGSYYIERDWDIIETQFEIFSLKTNSWRTIKGTDFPYVSAENEPRLGFLLNGALHWIAFKYGFLEDVIVAFDLIEEKSRELPLPQDFAGNFGNFSHFAVLGGCLSVCTREDDTTSIWIMKEYGVMSSWSKSVVLSLGSTTHYLISPICSTKNSGIVGQDYSLELVKFNHRGDLVEHRAYGDITLLEEDLPAYFMPHFSKAAVYTESLLSLPSVSEEGRQDLQQS